MFKTGCFHVTQMFLQVSTVESTIHVPIVHTEDASKFDYHIVQMTKSEDDLFVHVEPMPGIEATYIVYILYTVIQYVV